MKKLEIPLFIGPLFIGLLFVGVLFGPDSISTAQELLIPPAGGPHQLELPAMPDVGSGTRGSGTRESLPSLELPATASSTPGQLNSDPVSEPISAGDLQPGLQPFVSSQEYQISEPALLESTGTWLRRGFWYSEFDVLLMDRIWRRDNFILAFQGTGGGQENSLIVEGGRTGAEATPRLNIGRFLFRDHKNRDHNIEFVAFGGGQWTDSGRLDATPGGTLNVGFYNIAASAVGLNILRLPLDQNNISFDGATSTQYEYKSRFNSFELNYQVKSRMRKDRMELEPSGHWVRRAQPSASRSLLAGIRYFNLSENFDWDAFGIDSDNNAATAPQSGNYRVRTSNDLIGTQLGFSWSYETARWSLGLSNKSGVFLNRTDVDSRFAVTGGVTAGNNDTTVDNLSFLSEASLLGKWHLRPNFSLRAGLEIMYVSSIALAAEQMDFIPVSTGQSSVVNGATTFMGGLIGFEGYW